MTTTYDPPLSCPLPSIPWYPTPIPALTCREQSYQSLPSRDRKPVACLVEVSLSRRPAL